MANPARSGSSGVLPVTDSVSTMTGKSSISSYPRADWTRFGEVRAVCRQASRCLAKRQIVRALGSAAEAGHAIAGDLAHGVANELVAEIELVYACAVVAEREKLEAAEFLERLFSHFPELQEPMRPAPPEPDPYA